MLKENLNKISQRILDFLSKNPDTTSWDLKTNLNLSSSMMYLALGMLISENKIEISEEGINYHIKKFSNISEHKPMVAPSAPAIKE